MVARAWGSGSACARPRGHGGIPGASEWEAPALLQPRCPDQPPAAQAQRRGDAGAARVSAPTGSASDRFSRQSRVFEAPRPWLVLPLLLHSVPVWPGGPWWLGPCVPTPRQVRGTR